ncbi:MAG: plasmid mobilization relaxosome protein MobC [Oscillospiraceae bacterium]
MRKATRTVCRHASRIVCNRDNVNQIAHWANSKGYVSQAEIHEEAVRVNEAYMMVRDAFR